MCEDIRKKRHQAKAKNSTTALHRLGLNFQKYKMNPICFVEGDDSEYYGFRVKTYCDQKKPYFINCGGKSQVTKTFQSISQRDEYRDGIFMYFIDRDFDDKLNHTDIYETPHYAIENFYTSEKALESLLSGVFELEDEILSTALELYKQRQAEFHSAISYFTAWMVIQKEFKKNNPEINIKFELKNVTLTDLVKMDLDVVTKRYDLEFIKQKFPQAFDVDDYTIEQKRVAISKYNPQSFNRGKYEIQFLAKFLELLQENLGLKKEDKRKFGERRSVQLQIYNPISQFTSHADTPYCLIEYILRIWSKQNSPILS